MQSFILKFTPTRQSDVIHTAGEKFVYESSSTASNNMIIVKPDRGAEVQLKPGQWFSPEERAEYFTVRPYVDGATIDGVVVVGVGDFGDNATNSTVAGIVAVSSGTLQTTAGSVTAITNTDASPAVTRAAKLATVSTGTQAVGTTAVQLNADVDLKKIIVRNNHATAQIGIGLAGVTLASAPILLQPNDVWIEDRAAGAAWYAISDLAGGSIAFTKAKE